MTEYHDMLEKLSNATASKVLEYRGWQKTAGNYASYLSLVSNDGRVRPNYRLHGTTTGRLSCSDPNLQQIPRQSMKPWDGKLKAAFIPKDGYELWEFDYNQLELRLGAAYAKEEELLEIFQEGRDIFSEMASTLGMSRQDTKTLVYSLNYGAGINRISSVFGVDKERASDIRDNFYTQYPNLRTVSKRAATLARKNGKIKLWSGRYRHFDRPDEQSHKAFNSVIQGGSADIVMHTMIRLDEQVDDAQECRLLLQIHDSVVAEIRKDKVDYYKEKIIKVMEAVEPNFGVRFQVEAKSWYK
jgi:DNA polymerase-1